MQNNSERGVIEIVAAVIATALLVGLGTIAFMNYQANKKPVAATVTTPSAKPAASSTPDVTLARSATAITTVKALYDNYSGRVGDDLLKKKYLTQALQAKIANTHAGADLVLCAQNNPDRTTYDAPVANGGNTTVRVHTIYSFSGDNPIDVTVDGSSGLISDITCNLQQ